MAIVSNIPELENPRRVDVDNPQPSPFDNSSPAAAGFKKAEEYNWLDVSNERSRTYHFPDGVEYTILEPLKLAVKQKPEGDSHRVVGKHDSHYIRPGWIAISWKPKNGHPKIDF